MQEQTRGRLYISMIKHEYNYSRDRVHEWCMHVCKCVGLCVWTQNELFERTRHLLMRQ